MDYAGLQASVLRWSARETDASLIAELPELITLTTAMFNHGQDGMAPALRVREMETTATISPTDDYYPLPDDYLGYLTLRTDIDCDGYDVPFEISGANIYPQYCDYEYGALALNYYAKIPELSDENTSNWLLEKQPSAYLHGTLLQVSMFLKDNTLFQRSAALLKTIIDGLMAEETMAKYSRPRVRINRIVNNMSGIGHNRGPASSVLPDDGYSFLEIDGSLVEVAE